MGDAMTTHQCHLCFGDGEFLVDIADCWKTEKVSKICDDCAKILNASMDRSHKFAEDTAKEAMRKIESISRKKARRDFFNKHWSFRLRGKQIFMNTIDSMALKQGG